MKGIILAGGLGTRLYPLTHATNKHLLPVFDKPMIYYPIRTLVRAGIRDIMVVVSGPHSGDFIRVLKNGKEFGIKHLEYAYQDAPDGGIADALVKAESFADNQPVTVILGDNCTDANIGKEVRSFKGGALVFLKKVDDPNRFGIAEFDKKDSSKVIGIVEKPKKPKSNFAQTGVYIYDNKVFNYIKKIKPSARGQLEITDLNNIYINAKKFNWAELKGFWSDAGTFESLYKTSVYWARKILGKRNERNLTRFD
ncbi:MAG: spore coat protein [Candidatus Doudnabacteria bacterium RIFCSPLOWO2_01_FULL_44_21]|uniref:glucose-1-phosphate thymidylyltransferase n=1 Tax=Candidatus Doudnabacteria bacterium RIFCSPLOWO2_01_FULL_44_21 TaxID=1817841 RepID=A0A1F5PXR8_9BACT|nr:MAG: spore coat protein [Candidatus Doudnabacteria bacterium RIFCSPHIGHO2_02_FULL_43_13b]OGE94654.1 MAG: spore coat protein [Candidatus Doudnabacteria bacterium RIFCSPLOWO2_01_FULL_44_21]